MQDLTKITTPFGLLDAETQEALRAHGGPYQRFGNAGWRGCIPLWQTADTYRVKPQPPEPREWWIVKTAHSHGLAPTLVAAEASAEKLGGEVIHVREVL